CRLLCNRFSAPQDPSSFPTRRSSDLRELMARFKAQELDVLVATTVIEVGVDVPNATIMIIQEADRFGLAQLHQLRGRVGRAAERSEEHTSELQSRVDLVCRLLLEKKK